MNHETKQVIYNGVLVDAIDFGPVVVPDPCQAQQRLDAQAAADRVEWCVFGCNTKVYRDGWCINCWNAEHD